MSGHVIEVAEHGRVRRVLFGRGEANFIDPDYLADLADTLVGCSRDEDCTAIVLQPASRHFCAGADFSAGLPRSAQAEESARLYRHALRLLEVEVPVIAVMTGATIGAGLGLACFADLRVAAPSTRVQASFLALGITPGFGLTVTLPRVIGEQRAYDVFLSAERLRGEQAMAWGIADRFAADDHQAAELALDQATRIAGHAPLALRAMKRLRNAPLRTAVAAALRDEHEQQALLWQTEDFEIGVAAARDRLVPRFVGR